MFTIVLIAVSVLALFFTLLFSYGFAPEKCTVTGNTLTVKTKLTSLTYDLTSIIGARLIPHDSLRAGNTLKLFGVGWPFKPFGYFRNKELGTFLAFVTDRDKMVLITLPNKTLLVSLDNPQPLLARFKTN